MRKGQNPAKQATHVATPERITVAVLNYIPVRSGFFLEMPEVLKKCLSSLRNDPGLPFDLLVFDNGSCNEIQDYLLAEKNAGRIQYLFLSNRNLGKGGAWNIIFDAAPGEIVTYADNDVFFYPGWLKRSVEILETFPNTGMVTARPFRTKAELCTSTIEWVKSTPEVQHETGQFISWETFREFAMSIGKTEQEALTLYESSSDERVIYRGVTSHIGASHWQFTTYKNIIKQFLPFSMEKPMGQIRQLDEMINSSGYLRLMVSDPLAMNMSNTPLLTEELNSEGTQNNSNLRKKLREFPPLKAVLMRFYDQIFKWYYRD